MSQERSAEAPSPLSLAEILQKQGELLEWVAMEQDVPLTLSEVPHVERGAKLPWTDFESQQIARFVGWPSRHTWAGKPSVRFGGGESGDIEFFEKAVEESDFTDSRPQGLNNFWAILHTRPYAFDGEPPITGLQLAYAPMPALIRAWTAFPEFMDALQRDLSEIGTMYQMEDTLTEQIETEEPHLLRASRLAYGLLTRLVCRDDRETQATLQDSMFSKSPPTGPRRHFAPITDPSVELWT